MQKFIHSAPLAPQARMWPPTPPRRQRERTYSSTATDLVPVDESVGNDFENKTQRVEPTETLPLLSATQRDVIDDSDNAWNEIMADFPASVDDSSCDIDTYSGAVDPSATSNIFPCPTCTIYNRCQVCTDLSYFDWLNVHSELGLQLEDRLAVPFWEKNYELRNVALADLVRHSESLRARVMKPWGVGVGMGTDTSAAERA